MDMTDLDVSQSWGRPSPEQLEVIRKYVKGRRIRDYGCGRLFLARRLLELGARHVEGVDTEVLSTIEPKYANRFKYLQHHFRACPLSERTAFVSWPSGCCPGLALQVRYAKMVIYLGKCTDGVWCGDSQFWDEVSRRPVLEYMPNIRNTLIVYGDGIEERTLVPEEYAGLAIHDDEILGYQELHERRTFKLSPRVEARLRLNDLMSAIGFHTIPGGL